MPIVMAAPPNIAWWRPLFNEATFDWLPLLECRAVTLSRRETCWNLQECPKLPNRSQPLVGGSSPYYEDVWRRYCCLIRQIQPDKVVRWCRNGIFLRHFCVLYFQRAACSTFWTCILNSHWSHIMCRSMADIHSATAEIRRGKKKKDRRNHWAKI